MGGYLSTIGGIPSGVRGAAVKTSFGSAHSLRDRKGSPISWLPAHSAKPAIQGAGNPNGLTTCLPSLPPSLQAAFCSLGPPPSGCAHAPATARPRLRASASAVPVPRLCRLRPLWRCGGNCCHVRATLASHKGAVRENCDVENTTSHLLRHYRIKSESA